MEAVNQRERARHPALRAGGLAALTALLLMVPACRAVAAKTFSFSPRAPRVGAAVRFTAPRSLCSRGPCRYVWESTGAHGRGRAVRLARGQRVRIVFHARGTRWIRLTVTGAHGRRHRVVRKIRVLARAASRPVPYTAFARVPLPPCTATATPATFAGVFAAAPAGQVICLASGDYGTFAGAAKAGAVTVRGADGASASMALDLTEAENLRLLDLTIRGGRIAGRARNVTVGDSRFTGLFLIQTATPNANIVLNGNSHVDLDASGGLPARVTVWSSGSPSGVTIANSLFAGGDSDGVRPDADQVQIVGNEFANLTDVGANHTDPIQIYGGTRAVIMGNFFHQDHGGNISAYIMQADGGAGNLIEDNVFGAVRGGSGGGHGVGYGITLYSDDGSVIAHNTFQPGTCDFNIPCGTLNLGNKPGDPVSHGTVIRDNILAAIGGSAGTYTADHNLFTDRQTPVFSGPPTSWSGFRLAPSSPGRGAASDGSDIGIR